MHIRQLLSKPKGSYFIYETKKNPRVVAAAAQSSASSAKAAIQTETFYAVKPANMKRAAEISTLVKVTVLRSAKVKSNGRSGTTELTTYNGEQPKVKNPTVSKKESKPKKKVKQVAKPKTKKPTKTPVKAKKQANPEKAAPKTETPEVNNNESESN